MLTCKIVRRCKSLFLVQFGTTANVDLRIDDHVVIFARNLEHLDFFVETDEHHRDIVEDSEIVPVVHSYVLAESRVDFRVVSKVQLDYDGTVDNRCRDIVSRTIDLSRGVEQR